MDSSSIDSSQKDQTSENQRAASGRKKWGPVVTKLPNIDNGVIAPPEQSTSAPESPTSSRKQWDKRPSSASSTMSSLRELSEKKDATKPVKSEEERLKNIKAILAEKPSASSPISSKASRIKFEILGNSSQQSRFSLLSAIKNDAELNTSIKTLTRKSEATLLKTFLARIENEQQKTSQALPVLTPAQSYTAEAADMATLKATLDAVDTKPASLESFVNSSLSAEAQIYEMPATTQNKAMAKEGDRVFVAAALAGDEVFATTWAAARQSSTSPSSKEDPQQSGFLPAVAKAVSGVISSAEEPKKRGFFRGLVDKLRRSDSYRVVPMNEDQVVDNAVRVSAVVAEKLPELVSESDQQKVQQQFAKPPVAEQNSLKSRLFNKARDGFGAVASKARAFFRPKSSVRPLSGDNFKNLVRESEQGQGAAL